MFNFTKKYLILALLILLCLSPGSVLAYSTLVTVDGKDDAGIYPGQGAFARFQVNGSINPDDYKTVIPDNMGGQWTQGSQVINYYNSNEPYGGSWTLQSAGNIISPYTDYTVGDSLSGLAAGTYRISPNNGAYKYDFSWGQDDYTEYYWWKVYIKATQVYVNGTVQAAQGYIMGRDGISLLDLATLDASDTAYASYAFNSVLIDYNRDAFADAQSAFAAVQNFSLELSLAQGGALSFWIWDWNSIDNSGAISLNVTSVPEPSTFILLAIGLSCLIMRNIRSALSRRSSARVYVKK